MGDWQNVEVQQKFSMKLWTLTAVVGHAVAFTAEGENINFENNRRFSTSPVDSQLDEIYTVQRIYASTTA